MEEAHLSNRDVGAGGGWWVEPFVLELLDKMPRVQVKDEPKVIHLIGWIKNYEVNLYVDLLLDSVTNTNKISVANSKNRMAHCLASLIVITNWPEAKPVPEGFPQLVEQIQEALLLFCSIPLS